MPTSRLESCYTRAREWLLAEVVDGGHWVGELSSSALSTATAVMALEMVRRQPNASISPRHQALIDNGLTWIAARQNSDGGWGDTTKSISNISTTMLCHAALHAAGAARDFTPVVTAAAQYIERAGGIAALCRRYGRDKTFSVPILTQCALAGLVDWGEVAPLPFELACLPPAFYKTIRLPVVSYALPALIAIGQVRHHFLKPGNVVMRCIRDAAIDRSLGILERIQPPNGGFLEAAPLTSFVVMSLAALQRGNPRVLQRGVEFLVNSVRPDGSWPIDTNLATWLTTLAINALGEDVPAVSRAPLTDWLLNQQYRTLHPYTQSAPGGWAWTDLPGGVPDADDTPGAILALIHLSKYAASNIVSADSLPAENEMGETTRKSLAAGVGWLLDLQNNDGGWPTFCRGWGALPFDRSAPDLTAHCIRALDAWNQSRSMSANHSTEFRRTLRAIQRGFAFLERTQRSDGTWLPLWFGNQFAPDDENATYGTSRVLAAYCDTGRMNTEPAHRGLHWLTAAQNSDGSWCGGVGTGAVIESSVEETSLALEMLIARDARLGELSPTSRRGLDWLCARVEQEKLIDPSPIGFYFAKLWYFERLYPLIFAVAALGRARRSGLYP